MSTTSLLVLALGLYVVVKVFSLFAFPWILKRWFTLEHRLSTEEGYVATQDLSSFLGREGITRTDLRPSGRACFGDETQDVSSASGFISRGTKVVVVEVRNADLFVKAK